MPKGFSASPVCFVYFVYFVVWFTNPMRTTKHTKYTKQEASLVGRTTNDWTLVPSPSRYAKLKTCPAKRISQG
jgi:hypothetical protein